MSTKLTVIRDDNTAKESNGEKTASTGGKTTKTVKIGFGTTSANKNDETKRDKNASQANGNISDSGTTSFGTDPNGGSNGQ